LAVDRRQLAKAKERAETIGGDDVSEVEIALGTGEIVGADDDISHPPTVPASPRR
jgi:hypothetical protein